MKRKYKYSLTKELKVKQEYKLISYKKKYTFFKDLKNQKIQLHYFLFNLLKNKIRNISFIYNYKHKKHSF